MAPIPNKPGTTQKPTTPPAKPATKPTTPPPAKAADTSGDGFFDDEPGKQVGVEDDDNVVMDLSDVDENSGPSFDVIPAGTYSVVVHDSTSYKTSQAGNKMVNWVLQVVGGEHENRMIFYPTVYTKNGLPQLKKMLLTLNPEFDTSKWDAKKQLKEFIGLACRVKVRVGFNKQRGENTNNVREVMPAEGGDDFLDTK